LAIALHFLNILSHLTTSENPNNRTNLWTDYQCRYKQRFYKPCYDFTANNYNKE